MTTARHRISARSSSHRPGGKGARYRPQQLLMAANGAALLVVIAVLAAWAHHSLSAWPSDRSTDAATQPAESVGAAPPAPMLLQLLAWRSEAKPSFDALVTARHSIAAAAAQHDIAGTGVACLSAGGAVVDSQQQMPSPDPALNAALQQAITSYQLGLGHCFSGTQQQDAAELGQAATYFNKADIQLQAALTILDRELSGGAPGSAVLTV